MKLLILITFILTACVAASPTDEVLENEPLTALKDVVKATPFQQYIIQVRCARLAKIAGHDAKAADHLRFAKTLKPKELPESDLEYRRGFVDGGISLNHRMYPTTTTIKGIAAVLYAACSAVI